MFLHAAGAPPTTGRFEGVRGGDGYVVPPWPGSELDTDRETVGVATVRDDHRRLTGEAEGEGVGE
jgi:hypothetical protein